MLYLKQRDKRVVELISAGKDSQAIALLYDYSFSKIKKHIKTNSGNLQDAEDIFQDAVTILYRYIKTGKYDAGSDMDGFLFTTCKNLWINTVKKRQRMTYSEELHDNRAEEHTQEHTVIAEERERLIHDTFSLIGDRCKELLTQVIYFDCSMKDLVSKMGFSNEDSAKTQHYKCKQKLIQLISKNDTFKTILKDGI